MHSMKGININTKNIIQSLSSNVLTKSIKPEVAPMKDNNWPNSLELATIITIIKLIFVDDCKLSHSILKWNDL